MPACESSSIAVVAAHAGPAVEQVDGPEADLLVALAGIADPWKAAGVLVSAGRLVEDAVYGTGVIASAVRQRRLRVLLPVIRKPRLQPRPGRQPDRSSPETAARQWS